MTTPADDHAGHARVVVHLIDEHDGRNLVICCGCIPLDPERNPPTAQAVIDLLRWTADTIEQRRDDAHRRADTRAAFEQITQSLGPLEPGDDTDTDQP